MEVIKVLNNSLILALDDKGNEIVIMGKGIGFQKSTGHVISKEDIEKTFILRDLEVRKNIVQLAAEIDIEIFEITKHIIDYAKTKYNIKLMEHLYLSLTDHIAFALKRVQEGIIIPSLYNVMIKQLNPKEYEIAKYTVEYIKKQMHIELPDDEINNIAVHFINAQLDVSKNDNNERILEIINSILDIVQFNFMIKYDKESINYSRFVLHLTTFAHRLLNKDLCGDEVDYSMYLNLCNLYEEELRCIEKIERFILMKYEVRISNQEKMYLLIHVHKNLVDLRKR